MITEPRWKSYIVETTTPVFTPEQCNKIIQAGRAEPRNDAQVGNKKGIKGGVIDTSSVNEDFDLDEEINALQLNELRDFITTYNNWFSTNHRAEEFIEEDVSPGAGNSRRGDAPKKPGTIAKIAKGITKQFQPIKNLIKGKGYKFDD